MESLPELSVIKFNPGTLEYVRKQYDLDNLERLNEAIDILEEWIKKQPHFEKKEFRREFLERVIMNNKGSLEKCKIKLDRMCTLRTLIPDYYAIPTLENTNGYDFFVDAFLPKMTPDYGRIHVFKVTSKKYDTNSVTSYLKYVIAECEYLQSQDYHNHLTYISDWRDGNVVDFTMALNLVDFRKCMDAIFKGCNLRVKAIHMLTPSKTIEALVTLMKQVLSAKLGERIQIHKTIESLHEFVPKEILPVEYGGSEKPLKDLSENLRIEICSSHFTKHLIEMEGARTNEAFRQTDKFNNEYLGMSGTFRTLRVD